MQTGFSVGAGCAVNSRCGASAFVAADRREIPRRSARGGKHANCRRMPTGASGLYFVLGFLLVSSGAGFAATLPSHAAEVQAGSTATLTAASPSGVFGQTIEFILTVSGKAPGGKVEFRDSDTVLCEANLAVGTASSTATCATDALAVGPHDIFAFYSGDSNNSSSLQALYGYSIAQAQTSVSVTPSSSSIVEGSALTVAASVGVTRPGAGTPTGTIMVTATPGNASCSYSLEAPTQGCSISPTRSGKNTLTATYSGDGNFTASSGTTDLNVVFSDATLTLTSSPNPSAAGQAVAFTVTVSQLHLAAIGHSPEADSIPPEPLTGKVTISDGATLLATLPPDGNGQATYSTSSLTPGSHTLTAAYTGDETQGPGSATLIQQVAQPLSVSSVELTSSSNPSRSGQTVSFTATVTAQTPAPASRQAASGVAAAAPTGTITLHDNGALLGSVALNASGQATYSTSALSAGSHTIEVDYSGDANTAPASSTLTQQVAAAAPVGPAPALSPMAMLLLGLGFIGVAGRGIARSGSEASLGGSARRR